MSVEDGAIGGGLEANGQSTTSLLGMAFVQGEYNGFSSNRLSSKLSLNDRGSPDLESKDEQNFHSIGLDLDPDTMEIAAKEKDGALQGRDLQTPPALEMTASARPCSPPAPPRAVSYKRTTTDECTSAGPILSPPVSAYNNINQDGFASTSSVYLSRSDRGNVHSTISKMYLAQGQQRSPHVSCKT
jgi:hypothetical protein